jgi:hypothetical protein
MTDEVRETSQAVAKDVSVIVQNLRWWLADPVVSRTGLAARIAYSVSLVRPIALTMLGRDMSHRDMAVMLGVTVDMARRAYDRLDEIPDPPMPDDDGVRSLRL